MPLPLNILPPSSKKRPLAVRLNRIQESLQSHDKEASVSLFALRDFDRALKTTISLCPECLDHIPAIVYTRGNRVLMRKLCRTHGPSDALLENDITFYRLSNKDQWGRHFADDLVMEFPKYSAGCCGGGDCSGSGAADSDNAFDFTDQSANKSCTVLVEVTNACNLACAVCYSDAKGDRKLPFDLFKRYMADLLAKKGSLDSVQLTGGEAMLHPQFWEMLQFLHNLPGVKRVYLPTNGILLSRDDTASQLLPFKSKLMVLLQFDGQDRQTNSGLRNANPTDLRHRVLENLGNLGICTQLTMTIARGVNDHEIGWVVDTALNHRHVKLAALQPVTYSGRYELPPDPLERLTLSDVAKAVIAQASKRMADDQFVPIPCSHPNCGWITLFARRLGLTMNIVRHIDLARAMDQVAYKTVLSTQEIRRVLGNAEQSVARRAAAALGRKLVRAGDVVGIAIKPFMDRFNYDQDRVSACCHQLLDTHGNAVSFCEYNARLRPHDPWEKFPDLEF